MSDKNDTKLLPFPSLKDLDSKTADIKSEDKLGAHEKTDSMPSVVQKRIFTNYLLAIGLSFLVLFLAIYYKEPSFLVGFFMPVFLAYLGIKTKNDYYNGYVDEVPVLCHNINENVTHNKVRVVFRTGDDSPVYYEFVIPKFQARNLQINEIYVIYFNTKTPRLLMGYVCM